jgi:hypothetical protein
VKVLFQQIMFHMVIEGPERLHGQILGIPGLPGSIPVPLMQGKKSPIYKGIFSVLTACLNGRNKFYNVEQVCPVSLPSGRYSYVPDILRRILSRLAAFDSSKSSFSQDSGCTVINKAISESVNFRPSSPCLLRNLVQCSSWPE